MLDRRSRHASAEYESDDIEPPMSGPRDASALERRAREQEALFRLTDRLYRASSITDTYEAALDAILGTLGCRAASILRFERNGVMRFVAWRGLSEHYRRAVDGHSPWKEGDPDPEPVLIPDIEEADLPDDLRATVRREGIRALAFIPLTTGGRVCGKFMAYYATPQPFDRHDTDFALTVARQLGFSLDRAEAEEHRRTAKETQDSSERRLAVELEATKRLQEISAVLVHEGDTAALYEKILDAAVSVMGSDFASMQILRPERGTHGELELIGHRGFNERAERFWKWVRVDSATTCGVTLRSLKRSICGDVRACDYMRGSEDLAVYAQTGIVAVQTTPLVSRSGKLLGMLSTHWRKPHEPSPADLSRLDVLARQAADLIERADAEETLRDRQERLRAVFNSPAIGVAVLTPDGSFIEVNDAFSELSGYDAAELRSLNSLALTHPEDRAAMSALLAALMDGSRSDFVIEKRYRRKDGSVIWVQNSVSLTHDEAGRPLHLVKLIQNITERKIAEKRQRLLIDEINHRVKNTLATVQSFATQTLRNAKTVAEGRAAFEARLIALSKSHDILTRQHWEGADLIDVVNEAIKPYRSRSERERFRIDGGKLQLRPKAVLALSLAFHELATNAVKYGALSTDTGNVAISWRAVPESGQFALRWQETGGPPVQPPGRRGFGSRLVEQGLAQDIAGDARLSFNDLGVVCVIDAPLHEITGSD